ncbi:MAG TPA: error-prone DNA polymerase [Solirubrobacterales bacterium]|jgi:error-prone DNA polymerase|nr:error-prone DNA polymerase [Solirubrobacterales bacterium]
MAPTSPYVELHAHSAFSFLDGASTPTELAAAASTLGYTALALTDHDGIWGSREFAEACQGLAVRAITGAELTVAVGPRVLSREEGPAGGRGRPFSAPPPVPPPGSYVHITLLVEDATGYRNLCRLLTQAHAHTRDNTARAATPPWATLEQLEEHAAGLVCLSGCARDGALAGAWERGQTERGERLGRRLLGAFGRERFRVELQRPYWRHDRARNRWLTQLASRLGVPCVATGNVHSHNRRRGRLQDAFVAIGLGETLEESEPRRRGNRSSALVSPEEMAARFAEHPEAVAESVRLAERLQFDLTTDLGYRHPRQGDRSADHELKELCEQRLAVSYAGRSSHVEAALRLDEELATIRHRNLSGFFLIHHELLELAREVAVEVRGRASPRAVLPPGRGRGSSVSSIVCYLTGLSHIDPVEKNLFSGRFLNDEGQTLPDIDLDFPRDIREVLIPRVHEVYGADRSALVAAFPTYRPRGVVRDLGKALGLPPAEIERVAKTTGFHESAGEMEQDVIAAIGPERAAAPRWKALLWLCDDAMGLPRNASQHSGGMVISTEPLIDVCPIVPAAMAGRQIVQWDKDSCSDAGLLKIDLLGLGMLSAVERCVDEVERTRGEPLDLSRIALDDKRTYESIRAAETTGVFQIESRAQMQMLPRTRPQNLDDLTVQVALVRPGPIQGGAVHPYIERRKRQRRCEAEGSEYEIPYEHELLEGALEETLGTIVYQEQVLEVAIDLADFNHAEAEKLRRAMSRKRSQQAIDEHRDRFLVGAVGANEVPLETAERVWEQIQGFAGFGFPKAHSAAFGLLAYQSAWLRIHRAEEFLCALLNEQPMGFYPPDALVQEARRRAIRIAPPDANRSRLLCHVETPRRRAENPRISREIGPSAPGLVVRIGLGYVKGVRVEEMEMLVAERGRGGVYSGIADLASRSGAGVASLERLAWAGALDTIPATASTGAGEAPSGADTGERREALWRVGVNANGHGGRRATQLALPIEPPQAPPLRPLGDWGELIADYRSTGIALGKHPMELMRPGLDPALLRSDALERAGDGSAVEVAGMVVARQRPGTAKGIVFMTLEDECGIVNVIVPKRVYERHRAIVRAAVMVRARGRLERREGVVNVLVESVEPLEREAATGPKPPRRSQQPPTHLPPADPAPKSSSRRARELAVAELRSVAPAGHSFGRRGR